RNAVLIDCGGPCTLLRRERPEMFDVVRSWDVPVDVADLRGREVDGAVGGGEREGALAGDPVGDTHLEHGLLGPQIHHGELSVRYGIALPYVVAEWAYIRVGADGRRECLGLVDRLAEVSDFSAAGGGALRPGGRDGERRDGQKAPGDCGALEDTAPADGWRGGMKGHGGLSELSAGRVVHCHS